MHDVNALTHFHRQLTPRSYQPDPCPRTIQCDLNKGCGFACQIHHLGHCFLIAFATKRYFLLKSSGWQYDSIGFEHVFEPLGKILTCTAKGVPYDGTMKADHINVPIIDFINPRTEFLPMAVPKTGDYDADNLIRLHGNPFAYLMGHLLSFALRPSDRLKELIDKRRQTVKNIARGDPVVGVHVRRSDKIHAEASFHPLHANRSIHGNRMGKLLKFNEPQASSLK
ncbi:hypothetical protein ACOME3_004603 [Neoechinorhynchus agilis]